MLLLVLAAIGFLVAGLGFQTQVLFALSVGAFIATLIIVFVGTRGTR